MLGLARRFNRRLTAKVVFYREILDPVSNVLRMGRASARPSLRSMLRRGKKVDRG